MHAVRTGPEVIEQYGHTSHISAEALI
jgi:hypothetical protein